MEIENALARPFSRWDVAHGRGEPAYGYFARLVANEGHSSLRVYANEIGLNGRNLVPEEMLAAIKRLPLSAETIGDLERWTPIRDGSLYRIGAETARVTQMSITKRRWCCSCLREARHHRVWWDFTSYTTCPAHNEALVERTVRDEVIRWHWPHFDVGPDGMDLADGAAAGSPSAPTGLESFIEGRLRGVGGMPMEGVPLHSVLDAVDTLGTFLDADGFGALTMPDADLRDCLAERIRETVPEEKRRRGVFGSLGRLIYGSGADEPRSLQPWLERQFLEAFTQVGRIGRKRLTHADIHHRDFTLADAAAELGVNKKGLSRFAKRFGIGHTPWKDAHSFSKEDVEALRAKVADLITLQETIPITGILGHEFRFLERAGFIDSHPGLIPNDKAVRYLRADVVALVDRVLTMAEEGGDGEGVSLFSYAKRTGQKQGEVLVRIMRGGPLSAGTVSEATGFRRLLFSTAET
jgi:hypothetical protein